VGIIEGNVDPCLWTKTGIHVIAKEGFRGDANLVSTPIQREGWSAMRMKSVTPESVCIADGVVFISEDEARKYGDEMLTDGYIISHVTWEED
jgi:hypothetical protein